MMTPDALQEVLSRTPWFRGLPPDLAEGLLRLAQVRRWTDETVYAAGDPPNGLFALISGEVRIAQTTASGRAALLMIASPGVWFGEAAMIDGKPRTSEAAAVGAATLLQVTPSAFQQLTAHSGPNMAAFASLVCDQYRRAMDYIVETAGLSARVRLAQRLAELVRTHGRPGAGGIVIDLKLSQESLAEMAGVSRQTLNRLLKALEADGVVALGYRALAVRDPAALEALARSRTLPAHLAASGRS
ncbi:Crp/Fnr family transcriptional regulator [Phenylobacterium aquaticum]|uniref:Crp/Fnr family transcriptional regulator n=1 Tax=Phenylobacterium aquaticum TaxID=1763816 RepID=UPI001F5C8743|nr:Crp/Fnr family transcriptional regulator [Phenylobacterium aquaticum]MCI3132434.1 Crp/Fnr family transcriptional regulator [Phenylobacterium aquaticum]